MAINEMFSCVELMGPFKRYTYRTLDIHYRNVGQGKPLLILHGWGSSGEVMMSVAEQLSSIRSCYVIDLPGFGSSPEPDTAWSVDDYADFVEAFIDDLQVRSADLLVHSFGGRIAIKLCAREQGKKTIDKVLITGGAGMKPKRSVSFYLKKYTAKILKAPFQVLPKGMREPALARLRESRLWKSLGSSDYRQLSGVMRETFVKTVTEHLDTSLADIENEVLLLWGENDRATPLYQAERMEKGLKNAALVVIEEAGHYAFLDRPGHFGSIARAFFEG